MNWEKVFRADSQLRPMWRFLVSAVMIVLAYAGVGIVLGLLSSFSGRHPGFFARTLSANLLLLPALLGVCAVLTNVFERKPLASVGLGLGGRWKTELGIGLSTGTLMIVLVAALERLLGVANFSRSALPPRQLLAGGFFIILLLAVAAINEEVTFRGYPFQRLLEAVGPVGGVAVTSVLFGAVHLGNPHHTWVSTLNTALVGVPLAVAYLRTRALWLPIGLHFAWNFFEGYGLGFPVSGIVLPETLLRAEVRQVAWLTGGSYGPEGGVLATGAIVLGTVYLLFSRSIYVADETRELVFGPATATPLSAEIAGTSSSSRDASNLSRHDFD